MTEIVEPGSGCLFGKLEGDIRIITGEVLRVQESCRPRSEHGNRRDGGKSKENKNKHATSRAKNTLKNKTPNMFGLKILPCF